MKRCVFIRGFTSKKRSLPVCEARRVRIGASSVDVLAGLGDRSGDRWNVHGLLGEHPQEWAATQSAAMRIMREKFGCVAFSLVLEDVSAARKDGAT